jgi:hypothetical protein
MFIKAIKFDVPDQDVTETYTTSKTEYVPKDNYVYVSKPYDVDGNVSQVSLYVVEDHPVFMNQSDIGAPIDYTTINTSSIPLDQTNTSIEYYVSNMMYPSLNQWKPILPMDQKAVKNELLFFGQDGSATLRFKASPADAVVLCNRIPLNKNDWTFTSGCTKVVITNGYLPTNQYTIFYKPTGDPYNIDFNENIPLSYTESFDGSNHNKTVKLKYRPFIDYSKINTTENYNPNTSGYKPIKVTLTDSDIIGPNKKIHTVIEQYDGTGKKCAQWQNDPLPCPYVKNMTNYTGNMQPQLNKYDPISYPFFEYVQEDSRLYFTETFNKADIRDNMGINHGNAVVNVEYQYIASVIRVKVIMRRTVHGIYTPITPSVKEFTLRMKLV